MRWPAKEIRGNVDVSNIIQIPQLSMTNALASPLEKPLWLKAIEADSALRLSLEWKANCVILHHQAYAEKILKAFNMETSNALRLSENSKHIEIRFQFLRDIVAKNQLTVEDIATDDMITDMLTKPLVFIK
ncbi:hypothetical protein MJO29_016612, partial [Puccinia striiformis f. sp. tritici]